MTNTKLRARLTKINACSDALRWLGDRDAKAMYNDCKRGDWLIWLAIRLPNIDENKLHLLACDIARTVLPIYENQYPNDDRPRKAIEAKEAWVRGEINDEQLSAARDAAKAAAYAMTARAAEWAARAAEWAAGYAAGYVAESAADAAGYAAGYVAAADRAAADVAKAHKQHANLFRARISYEEIEKGLEAL